MKDKDTKILEEMYNKRFDEAIAPNGNRNGYQVSPTAATTNPNTGRPRPIPDPVSSSPTGTPPVTPKEPNKADAQIKQQATNPAAQPTQSTQSTQSTQPAVQGDPNAQPPAVDPQQAADPNSSYNQMIAAMEMGHDVSAWKANPMTGQQITPDEITAALAAYNQGM
ncbi:MAG: hypothetical protein GY861_16805 [bacterium]|nr:hypothetical protein [bacterium]